MAEVELITDHAYRPGAYTIDKVITKEPCAWLGTCRKPKATHATSIVSKYKGRKSNKTE